MVWIGSRGRRPRQGMRVSLQSLININLFLLFILTNPSFPTFTLTFLVSDFLLFSRCQIATVLVGEMLPHFHACDSSQNLFLYTAAGPTGTLHRSVGSPFCVQAAKPLAISVSPVKPCRIKKEIVTPCTIFELKFCKMVSYQNIARKPNDKKPI